MSRQSGWVWTHSGNNNAIEVKISTFTCWKWLYWAFLCALVNPETSNFCKKWSKRRLILIFFPVNAEISLFANIMVGGHFYSYILIWAQYRETFFAKLLEFQTKIYQWECPPSVPPPWYLQRVRSQLSLEKKLISGDV